MSMNQTSYIIYGNSTIQTGWVEKACLVCSNVGGRVTFEDIQFK